MDVPAFCDSCGTAFNSGIAVDNSRNISFVGNIVGPCPRCGGVGHVPDGVFNFVGNTIEILSAPQRTFDELSRLARIIEEAREEQAPPDAVVQKIRQQLPALAGLADLLPRTPADLYAFLTLIIAVLSLMTQGGRNERPPTNITVNQSISQVYVQSDSKTAVPHQSAKSLKKIGRNASCPCGSGKKYKQCCGMVHR